MGLAYCHPDLNTCKRIGLTVWLKRPAATVHATSANDTFALNHTDQRGIQMTGSAGRREFIGFFEPTGIVGPAYLRADFATHATPGPPVAAVKLTIVNSQGRTLVTRLRVPVEPGWG
jgi:hypothetical protein